jgi:hypothetical protein
MKSQNIVVYTAVFDDYDVLMNPKENVENIDYICFTDSHINSNVWETRTLTDEKFQKMSSSEKNRFVKMHPHQLFPDYEISLYIDANIYIKDSLEEFLKKYKNVNILAPKHYWNNCAYKEAEALKKSEKGDNRLIEKQMKKYREEGFPEDYGHTENNILLRRHNKPEIKTLMTNWWEEFQKESNRDQLSLSYILWRSNSSIERVKFGPRYKSEHFKIHSHKPKGIKGKLWDLWVPLYHKKNENLFYRLFYFPVNCVKITANRGFVGFLKAIKKKIGELQSDF